MTELVKICDKRELPKAGDVKEFSAGGRAFCLANLDGVIALWIMKCPHHGGPLGEGMIEDGKVVCPWHAWTFDPVTGASSEANEKVAVYPVSTKGDEVFLEV